MGDHVGTMRQIGGRWRAEVMVNGKRASRRFDTKTEAKAWIAATETDLRQPGHVQAAAMSGGELFDRFVAENGRRQHIDRETKRLAFFKTDPAFAKQIGTITSADMAGWRDRRLNVVTAGTVLREWNLLSAVFGWAVEHGLLVSNPLSAIKRPAEPPARDYLITDRDIELIGLTVGWPVVPKSASESVVWAFMFAIETAMRRGEILALEWSDIGERTATVRGEDAGGSKSGKRVVPLSFAAITLLDMVRHLPKPCPIASSTADTLWRRLRDRAGVDFHFHDSRHLAITRLSRRLDMLALARMVGHRNPSQLLTYYNPDPADLAARLD